MTSKVFGKIKNNYYTNSLLRKKSGIHKKLILDLTNYVNQISNKKEIFTQEAINQMSTFKMYVNLIFLL